MGRPVLAVAFVLVLAGCSGFGGADTAESVTPAPVPTDPAPYPPGITEHQVTPSVLASAHASALRNRSYTMTIDERITDTDGEHIYRLAWVQQVSNGSTTYSGQFQQNASRYRIGQRTSQVEYWTNGTLSAVQYKNQRGSLTRYFWTAEQQDPLGDVSGSHYIENLLSIVELSVVRHDKTDRTVLRGTTVSDPEQFITAQSVTDPTNVTVSLVVLYDGTVVRQRIAYDAMLDETPVHVVRETRVRDIGTTTVRKPEWIKNSSRADSPSVIEG